MPVVLLPGRNPIIKAAFAGLRAEERKAKSAKKEAEPAAPAPTKKTSAKKGKKA